MTFHPIITGILLGVAVGLTLICSIGVLVMRDAYQRLHFSAPVVTISMPLIVIAIFLESDDPQARIKGCLIFVLLLVMNSILTHATARAFRIREMGRFDPTPQEKIPVVENRGIAGVAPFGGKQE
ncbi:MAG TPA: monovalent cation/H(+) antiporter subunit G [Tepidisphaeraceae bacterium]|nr:monovalent cation/H(+) antiporter subunit G [Tepidisphaeraceae bacterium]